MQDVPKIVRARLQRPAPATAQSHPDADLLTAFAERTLAGRERDHVLEHLARCSDCRDVVAFALPATEDVTLASSESSARIGWLSLPVLRWGVVAAGVVLLTSVGIFQYRQRQQEKTLVATSVISREQPAASAPQSPAPSSSAAASQPVAPSDAEKRTEIAKQTGIAKKSPAPSGAPNALAVSKPPVNQQVHAPNAIFPRPEPMRRSTSAGAAHHAAGAFGFTASAGRSSKPAQVATPRGSSAFGYESKNSTSAVIAQQNSTPGPSQPAAVPSATTNVEVSAAAPPVTTETTAQSQIQDQSIQDDASEPQSKADRVGKAKSASAQASPAMAPVPLLHGQPILVKSPLDIRWTISASGALQRSLDGGKTWLDVNIVADDSMSANFVGRAQTGTTVELQTELKAQSRAETSKTEAKGNAKSAARPSAPVTAKSAPAEPAPPAIFRAVSVSSNAAEVWAGGSGGALYHTVDGGNRWARVIPSDAAGILTGDIIAIQFSNPRNGIVTTSTTEVWTTVDAGQTWHKRQ